MEVCERVTPVTAGVWTWLCHYCVRSPEQSTARGTHLHSTLITPMPPCTAAPLFSPRARALHSLLYLEIKNTRRWIWADGVGFGQKSECESRRFLSKRFSCIRLRFPLLVPVNCVSELGEAGRPTVCGWKWHLGIFCMFIYLFNYCCCFSFFFSFFLKKKNTNCTKIASTIQLVN